MRRPHAHSRQGGAGSGQALCSHLQPVAAAVTSNAKTCIAVHEGSVLNSAHGGSAPRHGRAYRAVGRSGHLRRRQAMNVYAFVGLDVGRAGREIVAREAAEPPSGRARSRRYCRRRATVQFLSSPSANRRFCASASGPDISPGVVRVLLLRGCMRTLRWRRPRSSRRRASSSRAALSDAPISK